MSPLFVIGLPKYSGAGLAHPLQAGTALLFLGLLGELLLEQIAESRGLGLRLLRCELLQRGALLAIRTALIDSEIFWSTGSTFVTSAVTVWPTSTAADGLSTASADSSEL